MPQATAEAKTTTGTVCAGGLNVRSLVPIELFTVVEYIDAFVCAGQVSALDDHIARAELVEFARGLFHLFNSVY